MCEATIKESDKATNMQSHVMRLGLSEQHLEIIESLIQMTREVARSNHLSIFLITRVILVRNQCKAMETES